MDNSERDRLIKEFGRDYWNKNWGLLRVGVRIRSNADSIITFSGTIHSINSFGEVDIRRDDGEEGGGATILDYGRAWRLRQESIGSREFIQILDTHMASGLSANPLDFYRDMNDTEDSRLLKKYGLENPTNVPTEAGYQLSRELMYKEHRDKIIEIVKKMEAADKSSKKASE